MEPNEVDFNQCFCQKVASTNCSAFNYGRLLKCEGIINAIMSCNTHIPKFENPKADQIQFFLNTVIFEPP